MDETQAVWAVRPATLASTPGAPSAAAAVAAAAAVPLDWQPASTLQAGLAVWGGSRASLGPNGSGDRGDRGVFEACVTPPRHHISALAAPAVAARGEGAAPTLLIAARAVVDQNWGDLAQRPASPANAGPQTHLARARTDPTWLLGANGREVRGQREFLSDLALELELGADGQPRLGATPKVRSLGGALALRRLASLRKKKALHSGRQARAKWGPGASSSSAA